MADSPRRIDVTDDPALLSLAEEVYRTKEPSVLERDGEDLALIVPMSHPAKRQIEKSDRKKYEAFRRAAGSWADVDTDKLIEDIYATRRRS